MITFPSIEHLEEIDLLWKQNRATLGLMPKQAFVDCINKKWILISLNESNKVDGYLQFRYTNRTQAIAIVHLCVDKFVRGRGIAKKLLDFLVVQYKGKATGIRLNCRSDYDTAIKFWQKYNFQPKGQLPSRGSNPNVHLVTWWFNLGKADLFSSIPSNKINAVLDFNIIAKLRDQNHINSTKEEIQHLQADWLVGEVEYFKTSETLSEIFRDQNPERKFLSKSFIQQFQELNIDKPSINELEIELQYLIGGSSENDLSDRRQIAEAILSGFPYFITLDRRLLKCRNAIEEKYSLNVVSPSSFVLEIDETKNAADYFPYQLSGNSFTINKATSKEKDLIAVQFLDSSRNEKKNSFSQQLDLITQNPLGYLNTIKHKNEIVSVIGSIENADTLKVKIIRTKQSSLRQTIFMQNVYDLINKAVKSNKNYIEVTEINLTNIEKDILLSYGFYLKDNVYIRSVSKKMLMRNSLRKDLESTISKIPEIKELIDRFSESITTTDSNWNTYYLEKKLWPTKIKDIDIPCFIVPIKPSYARELFDTKAAKENLFGVTASLIWNKENVYYRTINPNIEKVPARILWYASQDKQATRQMSVVCSSYLDEIIIGPAKEIYKKHKRYGVYDWNKHIKPLTKGNELKQIKILKFSDSEPFSIPVSMNKVKSILKKNNEKDNNFQAPLKINSATFMEIYCLGKGISHE